MPHWILPVGLSFYSLQVIAYLADVYRRKIRPQENVLKYALFVSFFPLIVQGPISRYDQLESSFSKAMTGPRSRSFRGSSACSGASF